MKRSARVLGRELRRPSPDGRFQSRRPIPVGQQDSPTFLRHRISQYLL